MKTCLTNLNKLFLEIKSLNVQWLKSPYSLNVPTFNNRMQMHAADTTTWKIARRKSAPLLFKVVFQSYGL